MYGAGTPYCADIYLEPAAWNSRFHLESSASKEISLSPEVSRKQKHPSSQRLDILYPGSLAVASPEECQACQDILASGTSYRWPIKMWHQTLAPNFPENCNQGSTNLKQPETTKDSHHSLLGVLVSPLECSTRFASRRFGKVKKELASRTKE